jgi:hypothetical protein
MASTTIQAYGSATISVPASSAIATFGAQSYQVNSFPVFANVPTIVPILTFNSSGANTTAAYANTTQVVINAGGSPVMYNVGTGPVLFDRPAVQPTPTALNATGTLTAAMVQSGLVTSTTAAAVVATLDTGTLLDAASTFAVNDSFDWSAVATGANSFTVTASAGHTVTGSGVVATGTSGRFRTYKTAAATFVTARLS